MANIFYALGITDNALSSCLDAVRLLSNPTEKHTAHITVSGPHKRRKNTEELEKLNSVIRGKSLTVSGVGQFFSETQNTVFLKCTSPSLRLIWNKSDYEFNPHITIYDGGDRLYAEALLEFLEDHRLSFSFCAEQLFVIRSAKGQKSMGLQVRTGQVLFQILKEKIAAQELFAMSVNRRIELVTKVLEFYSVPRKTQTQGSMAVLEVGSGAETEGLTLPFG